MEVFVSIMFYSVLVLAALSIFGGALVALAVWLVDNSEEHHAH
ncbi:MAG: hypothetical protein WD314_05625 [Trueperaceae bacterium]